MTQSIANMSRLDATCQKCSRRRWKKRSSKNEETNLNYLMRKQRRTSRKLATCMCQGPRTHYTVVYNNIVDIVATKHKTVEAGITDKTNEWNARNPHTNH